MKKLLLLALTTLAVQAQFLLDPYWFAPVVSCTNYTTAETAVFSGSTTYIYRSSNLAGVADGKQIAISVWVKPSVSSDGLIKAFFEIENNLGVFRVRLYKEANNTVAFVGRNAAGTQIVNGINTNTIVSTSGLWYHLFVSVDLTDTSKRIFTVNGAPNRDGVDWTTYTDDTMDILAPAQHIASNAPGTEQYVGALAELWMDDVYVSDDDDFRCPATGRPAELGATGAVPTGTSPAIYLSRNGSGNSWATDSSVNGNTFTLQNALGSTTSP